MVDAGVDPDDPALRAVLRRANQLEPDWIPPLRLADDLALQQWLGPELLEERRDGLRAMPEDPVQQYLTGRLEGPSGSQRFEFAADLDPASAWASHGRAWTAGQFADFRGAAKLEREAVQLSRDAWESAFFRVSLARYLRLAREYDAAVEVMLEPSARIGLSQADRAWFELETALVQIAQPNFDVMRAGYRRGIDLLRHADLPEADLTRLATALAGSLLAGDLESRELQLALAARRSEVRDRLRAQLLVSRSGGPLSLAMAEHWAAPESSELPRGLYFYAERFSDGVNAWLAQCPPQVLQSDGMPKDERLRRVVESARAADGASGPARAARLIELGDAFVRAGWFNEAATVADALAAHDLDAALALNDRSIAGDLCVERLADRVTAREGKLPKIGDPTKTRDFEIIELGDRDRVTITRTYDRIDRWLIDLAPVFADAHGLLGGETDVDVVREQLLESPRLDYGPIGALLHPGLRFSAADERAGLGERGAVVPGFAHEIDRLGRFAIIGTLVGRGLDGMILRRVAIEERSGNHLGVAWQGTVAWCEGLDAGGVNDGAGVKISGAALHEGYWVDLRTVRLDHARWKSLESSFDTPAGLRRVARALETRGLPLTVGETNPEARDRQRRSLQPALEQSKRMRLAVLAERRESGAGSVTLGELVECVSVHEEGHLCDRTRYLPLHRNLGSAFFLLLDNGFSPTAIQERLEYRAQLTALCVLPDPRLAFTEVVHSAEVTDDGPLPHAKAYRRLLSDMLEVLDLNLVQDPTAWPKLDRDRMLLHQLHRLNAEDVRRLSLLVARREGLVQD